MKSITSVLFVCMGNICRSPTAEALCRAKLQQKGLNLRIDSAGTLGFHRGNPPDPRAVAAGEKRHLSFDGIFARQITAEDFEQFDLILAADKQNLVELSALCPPAHKDKLHLMLSFGTLGIGEVPDPYYGSSDGFETVLDLLDDSLERLLEQVAVY
ncbi:low molecular weight protein-tyrosine-phosphatase [Shewanella salipaludis]|uniref:protein-tyrosine-phosphatase n=1 Tax=Shewanella salipaludis TaxID=2723052 RepID=A0A972JI17_9GAMM|nr:low molecular weight protein-tyrosine-phosphatase [Shewanella salipaludis]NMH63710.1 low molecular weight phosphotyrosine protein phosphatase [Shewanella salipaludis]